MKLYSLFFCLLLPFNLAQAVELPLPKQPHIVVEGHGVVEQIPDLIKIHFEVSVTAETLSQAKNEVDKTVGKAIQAAHKQNIEEDQIVASKIQAHPQYDWTKAGRQYKGEKVSRLVQITLTESKRYNALVDALLAAGVNSLQDIKMDFSNRQSLENEAMKLALADAKQQAKSMTAALNNQLAGVFQIASVGQPMSRRGWQLESTKMKDSAPSGLKLGKQKVEQRVRVVYLLKN
jgi:uncharacterized protein